MCAYVCVSVNVHFCYTVLTRNVVWSLLTLCFRSALTPSFVTITKKKSCNFRWLGCQLVGGVAGGVVSNIKINRAPCVLYNIL